MDSTQLLSFPPFRLDLVNERLWRESQEIPLRPKIFTVLRYLVEHADRLVTKEELHKAVWPETYVGDAVLLGYIRDLRRLLGEDTKAPRFIQTMHKRGYRFIAPVAVGAAPPVQGSTFKVQCSDTRSSALRIQHSVLVGRETELAQLHGWLDKAVSGERQMVFVTGEPGIGKTSLVDTFLQSLASSVPGLASENQHNPFLLGRTLDSRPQTLDGNLWIGRGQCIEHYGAGEGYMPVLEALGRLCREPDGSHFLELLAQHAPTWLVQMPTLLSSTALEALQRKTAGATRERMLRELAEALEAFTIERPMVLSLEDLHWSDPSTLELLSVLARRREAARLLVLCTYRPLEMLSDGRPLKQVLHELYAHHLGQELALRRLTESEVSAYLTLRFPESVLPARLGPVLRQRTGGNPLFLASMVQEMVQREVLSQADNGLWTLQGEIMELERWTPESVRHVLARQRERLAQEEHRVLEAASVAGAEFSAAAVAAALETEVAQIEDHCGRLAEQQHFLRLAGISEWPDGTRAGQYGFLHALYQEFWHERVSVSHQQQWHLRIGERKEAAYGQRAGEIAAELALHFEQGRDYLRAVQYHQRAGQKAVQRSANTEAISHLTRGLELLETIPGTPECLQQELLLQTTLGPALMAAKGYAAPEVERAYARARELCHQMGEAPRLLQVLLGLESFYFVRGKLQTACELGEQSLSLAQHTQEPARLLQAHFALGSTLFYLGELASAREHLEQGIAFYDPQKHHRRAVQDPGVACLSYVAWAHWFLGYPEQALKRSRDALVLAQELAHPFSSAVALCWAADLHQFRREVQSTQELAEEAIALAIGQEFPFWLTAGTLRRGRSLAEQGQVAEGIAQMEQGLAAYRVMGAELGLTPFLAKLAEAHGKLGQTEEGLTVLAEALVFVDKTGERFYEAELY